METENDADDDALPFSMEIVMDRMLPVHDRTLMDWVKPATSLIGFGLVLYKFFQYPQEQEELEQDGRVYRGHSSARTLPLPAVSTPCAMFHVIYGI
jgi:hypothetical protein